jgi:isochorismate pyruvate lyase
MEDVRRNVNALDDVLVPLLVTRIGYMQQAARIKDVGQVRDEARIEAIVSRVRERTAQEGGQPDVMETVYRALMEACIAYEHQEFARLREPKKSGSKTMKLLMVDNYDSFTYNIVQYFGELGAR